MKTEKKQYFKFNLDTYDSGFFNKRIGRLKLPPLRSSASFSQNILGALYRAKVEAFDLLTIRLPYPSPVVVRCIEKARFKRSTENVNLVFACKKALKKSPVIGNIEIGVACAADSAKVANLARRAFRLSYLYRCRLGNTRKIDQYHAQWAKNLLKNRMTRVFIARKNSRVAGFMAIKIDKPLASAGIILITVDKKFRNQGIATALIQKCIAYCRASLATITVRTQKNNLAAVTLYQRMGFRLLYRDIDFYRVLK